MAQPPDAAEAAMVAKLEEMSGRSLAAWIALVKESGLEKHGAIVTMLKRDHGVTHGYANLITHRALRSDAAALAGETDLVTAMYAGEKAALRSIHDRLVTAIATFGRDVELAPKKGYVSLRRNKQFGIIQPSTKTRVDVGINLKGVAATDRLEASGSFSAMVTHRVRLARPEDVDSELIDWLRKAFDAA
jgi:hypothetical protein